MLTMDEHGGPRSRLGSYIRQRRADLGMSVRKAAQEAEIDRDTWSAAESGNRAIHTHNVTAIERVLGWAPGSADKVLAGGEPDLAPTPPPKIPGVEAMDDPLVLRILASPLPDDDKVALIHMALRERKRADETMVAVLADRVSAFKRWTEQHLGMSA
jgi:transcriptional regulator with XRE-family HTH domain